jgi:hypothetical protein
VPHAWVLEQPLKKLQFVSTMLQLAAPTPRNSRLRMLAKVMVPPTILPDASSCVRTVAVRSAELVTADVEAVAGQIAEQEEVIVQLV